MSQVELDFLRQADTTISNLTQLELENQRDHLELVAQDNYTSPSILAVQGSLLANDDDEGCSFGETERNFQINEQLEQLAISRAKQLFGAVQANVRPHSVEQANLAVILALLKSGDRILTMSPLYGEPLSCNFGLGLSEDWYRFVHYEINPDTETIDYEQIRSLALQYRPRLIMCGGTDYPRSLNFERFRAIASEVGAYLLADISYFAALVVTGYHPNPLPYCDVVTTTTDQTLRGTRGGLIMTQHPELGKKIDDAVFSCGQNEPLKYAIAAKAVAFQEALQPDFAIYVSQYLANAQALASQLQERGLKLVSNDTENHLLLVDLSAIAVTVEVAERLLSQVNIFVNSLPISSDSQPFPINHRLCMGSLALTTRGLGVAELTAIGNIIADRLLFPEDDVVAQDCYHRVADLCSQYPLYPHLKLQMPRI